MESKKSNEGNSTEVLEDLISVIQSKGISYLDMLTYLRKNGYMESEVREAMKNIEQKQLSERPAKPLKVPVTENETGDATELDEFEADEIEISSEQKKVFVEFDEANDEEQQAKSRTDGQGNMILGFLMFIAGIAITALSYQAAANSSGGGSYVITYGLIIWGAVTFFKGLAQSSSNSSNSNSSSDPENPEEDERD